MKKKSINIITKYEVTELLGTRSEQIARGSKPFIHEQVLDSLSEEMKKNVYILSQIEFYFKKSPYTIRRYLDDILYEDWSLDELYINYDHYLPHELIKLLDSF